MKSELAPGVWHWPVYLDSVEQQVLLDEVMGLTAEAPFYRPGMPRTGHKLSVEMTNLGQLGWFTDAANGYRYEQCHPEQRTPWPAIPNRLLAIWDETTRYGVAPEACLVNLYRMGARMGLHRDQDEDARDAPVVSVSLGDSAQFRFGPTRNHKTTQTVVLKSGDVLVFGGSARLMFHGVDRIFSGTNRLVRGGGRINLTLRRVTLPEKKATDQGGDRSPNALFALGAGRG